VFSDSGRKVTSDLQLMNAVIADVSLLTDY